MNAYLGMKDGQWGVLKTLNVKNPGQVFPLPTRVA